MMAIVDSYTRSVRSYERTLKKSSKADPEVLTEIERQKTIREQERTKRKKMEEDAKSLSEGMRTFQSLGKK